jgi:hypothetical protein
MCRHVFLCIFQLSAADPAMSLTRGQPNVEVALSTQPDVAQQELRKPTIGGRKPQAKRLGVGRLFIIISLLKSHDLFIYQ